MRKNRFVYIKPFQYIRLLISTLILVSFTFSIGMNSLYAQDDASKFELRGYISNMQSVLFENIEEDWVSDNLFHNRLNLFWYPGSKISGSLQIRNRFMYGQSFQIYPGYASSIANDNNFLDMSWNLLEEKSFLLNTAIDRFYFQYSLDKFVFTIGRQRINWGQCFTWNPNDIFNVQNFFDFDYEEKPGSDALRLQYYPDYSSTLELVAKLNNDNKLSLAGYYKFNKWAYDIQVLGGVLDEEDYVIGFGWAGDIKGAGFRGETSYFHPVENSQDTSGILYSGISIDYTFSNSLYLQTEVLYSILPDNFSISDFVEFYSGPLSVKKLSFSEWNFFGQAAYPLTPLWNIQLSGMYFPDLKGYYVGPGITYSLKDNAELSLISQIFSGKFQSDQSNDAERTNLVFGFLRYKFSF